MPILRQLEPVPQGTERREQSRQAYGAAQDIRSLPDMWQKAHPAVRLKGRFELRFDDLYPNGVQKFALKLFLVLFRFIMAA